MAWSCRSLATEPPQETMFERALKTTPSLCLLVMGWRGVSHERDCPPLYYVRVVADTLQISTPKPSHIYQHPIKWEWWQDTSGVWKPDAACKGGGNELWSLTPGSTVNWSWDFTPSFQAPASSSIRRGNISTSIKHPVQSSPTIIISTTTYKTKGKSKLQCTACSSYQFNSETSKNLDLLWASPGGHTEWTVRSSSRCTAVLWASFTLPYTVPTWFSQMCGFLDEPFPSNRKAE